MKFSTLATVLALTTAIALANAKAIDSSQSEPAIDVNADIPARTNQIGIFDRLKHFVDDAIGSDESSDESSKTEEPKEVVSNVTLTTEGSEIEPKAKESDANKADEKEGDEGDDDDDDDDEEEGDEEDEEEESLGEDADIFEAEGEMCDILGDDTSLTVEEADAQKDAIKQANSQAEGEKVDEDEDEDEDEGADHAEETAGETSEKEPSESNQTKEEQKAPEEVIEKQQAPEQVVEEQQAPKQIEEQQVPEEVPEQVVEEQKVPEQIEEQQAPEQVIEEQQAPEQVEGQQAPEQIVEEQQTPEQVPEVQQASEQVTEEQQTDSPSNEGTVAASEAPEAGSIASTTVTAPVAASTPSSATTNSNTAADNPLSKTRHLQDIESTEQDMTSSLQKQLEHARETTASLKGNTLTFKTDVQAAQQSNDPEILKTALAEALEKQKEHEITIKKLRHEVDVERGHATILRHDNQVLRQMKANMHAVAEQEEENISNRLLKRISGLKKEKGELMLQVEQEEEYLTKTLQKKLSQLQKEKIDMENALEQEQEYIVNRLQKQLDAMRMEQSASTSTASSWQDKEHTIGSSLPIGSSPINIAGGGRSSRIHPNPSPTPSPTHKKWIPSHSPSSSDHGPSHPIVDMLKAELTAAKATLNELEREYLVKFKQCNRYRSEVLTLRQEYGLPIASDLLVEDNLPGVLSSTHRTGGTPSRRHINEKFKH
ncbi:hypothetical protein BGX27_004080 [Mortierella sp. AM989]|nr:hypothetical protein BGX27_004080 [Mortierella sp. AM989]